MFSSQFLDRDDVMDLIEQQILEYLDAVAQCQRPTLVLVRTIYGCKSLSAMSNDEEILTLELPFFVVAFSCVELDSRSFTVCERESRPRRDSLC